MNLEEFAKKMGYDNKWKFVRSLIFDAIMISLFVWLGLYLRDQTLICPANTISYPLFNNTSNHSGFDINLSNLPRVS